MMSSRSVVNAARRVAARPPVAALANSGAVGSGKRSFAQTSEPPRPGQAGQAGQVGPSSRLILQSSSSASSSSSSSPSTSSGRPVKVPLSLYGVDGTYATALYTAAVKSNKLDATARAIDSLANLFKRDRKLATVLQAPTLAEADRKTIVSELQRSSGGDAIAYFLATIAENNRLSLLAGIFEKFQQIMGAHKGEVELIVTSAAPLEGRVVKQLETAVSKSQYVTSGQKLKVVSRVNPDIKGGLVVEIGDRTIDLSVASKMAKLNKLLKDSL